MSTVTRTMRRLAGSSTARPKTTSERERAPVPTNGEEDQRDLDINVALGGEIRSAREAARLTRPELVARLPCAASVPTLANWEMGKRAIPYAKLMDVGRALGVSGPDLFRRAAERVAEDARGESVESGRAPHPEPSLQSIWVNTNLGCVWITYGVRPGTDR